MAQIDIAGAILYVKDGGSNYVEVKIGEGNFQYTEEYEREFVKSRGELDTVRDGEEQPLQINFDFIWEYVSSATGATIEDALKKKGAASSWESTSPDPDAPYCVDLELVYVPGGGNCLGEDVVEHLLFKEFYHESLGHSLKDGTIDCRGKCNAVQPITSRTDAA